MFLTKHYTGTQTSPCITASALPMSTGETWLVEEKMFFPLWNYENAKSANGTKMENYKFGFINYGFIKRTHMLHTHTICMLTWWASEWSPCLCVWVCEVGLSSAVHPVPACPAFRQLPDQPWGFHCNLHCITLHSCPGVSFRAKCPRCSQPDAAIL